MGSKPVKVSVNTTGMITVDLKSLLEHPHVQKQIDIIQKQFKNCPNMEHIGLIENETSSSD